MLKEDTIKELKKILKEDYGQDLSMKEATETADILVRFFDLLSETHYQSIIKESDKTKESNAND
jgi:hypothetical protein